MNLVPKGGHQRASSPTSLEMRQIARKWESFVSGGEVDLTNLSPVIREAWIRSKKAGIDPAMPHAPLHEIPSDPEILRQEIDWLPCADRIFSLLCNFFTESHQAVYLVDHQGRLLAIHGGRKAMANAEKIYAIPGGEWSEEKVGCGAIGTSLYTGLPVQVCWEENYITSLKEWASLGAPIHDPVTGEVLGAIGIGGHEKFSHPRAFELFIEAAELIEAGLKEREQTRRFAILERYGELAGRYPTDGLLALDKRGKILTLSPAIEKMLSVPRSRLIGELLQDVPSLRDQLGAAGESTSIEQFLSRQQLPVVTLFPVAPGRDAGSVLLFSQPTPSARKQTEHSWTTSYTFANLVGNSRVFRECIARAERASHYDWPVMLLGESGTGKELFAQSIHSASTRRRGPFVPLDCASLSDELIGMELFGYDEGAFTGAAKGGKPGKLELAHQGTLFLDDVDNLPAKVQIGLLRVLENQRVVPLGGSKPCAVDIRVIAASNRDLEQLVREGKFRADLYHRLRVVAIHLPSLRERSEDIPLLAEQILTRQSQAPSITDEAIDALRQYNWPGNVRELKNVLTEAAAYTTSQCITASDLPTALVQAVTPPSQSRQQVLDNTEAELIARAVQQTGSVTQAARRLGLHHATIYRRMKKYNIPLPTER